MPLFGILKRDGKVNTKVIPDCRSSTLMSIIEQRIVPDSIVYRDSFSSYNALDGADLHHFWINHSELFAGRQNHMNGFENFGNQAKRRLRRFNGIPNSRFRLYLKECEWRFNYSDPEEQLRQLKQLVKENSNSYLGQPLDDFPMAMSVGWIESNRVYL